MRGYLLKGICDGNKRNHQSSPKAHSKPKHFLTSLKQKSYNRKNDAVVPNIIEGDNNGSENEIKDT